MIVELHQSLLSTDFQNAPGVVFDALSAAKTSVSKRARLIAVYIPLMLIIKILYS